MNHYVNLMSPQARIREIRRTRLRQWAKVYCVVAVLLVPPALVAWWPVHRQRQHLAALESRYEPVRQSIALTKSYRQKIEQIREQDRLALALAKKTPVIALLGLIGKAVASTDGLVYVQHVGFLQAADPWTDDSESRGVVTLQGLVVYGDSLTKLSDSLRSIAPFAAVELASSETVMVHGEPRRSFTIKGSL